MSQPPLDWEIEEYWSRFCWFSILLTEIAHIVATAALYKFYWGFYKISIIKSVFRNILLDGQVPLSFGSESKEFLYFIKPYWKFAKLIFCCWDLSTGILSQLILYQDGCLFVFQERCIWLSTSIPPYLSLEKANVHAKFHRGQPQTTKYRQSNRISLIKWQLLLVDDLGSSIEWSSKARLSLNSWFKLFANTKISYFK